MTHSHEQIVSWLDDYFEAVNANQGGLDVVINSRKYFSDDLEFKMFTAAKTEGPLSLTRGELLMLFVHPGLHEKISPNYYVIDVESLRAVVQFEVVFSDMESGRQWPARQASAHYQLAADAAGQLQITKIHYWTQLFTEEFASMFGQWEHARDVALLEFGSTYFNDSKA